MVRNVVLPTHQGTRPRRSQSRTLRVIALLIPLGMAALLAWHYRIHLVWRYQERRLGLHEVDAIPDRQMPECTIPEGWMACHVGCIEFSLPPELASNRAAPANGASMVTFNYGSRAVAVAINTDAADFSELLKAASQLSPEHEAFTIPRLRRACNQVSTDDFCWSMTADEVRWHAFCLTTSKLANATREGHTESFSRHGVDGITHFTNTRAVLVWQSTDLLCSGYIHFIDREEPFDATWIRAACQSLSTSK